MLTIRRFQKGDEEILSVMIRRTLREVNYTSPKSELDYLIPHYSPETMVELSETGHTYVLEEDGPTCSTKFPGFPSTRSSAPARSCRMARQRRRSWRPS